MTGCQDASTDTEGEKMHILCNTSLYTSRMRFVINTVSPEPEGPNTILLKGTLGTKSYFV